MPTTKQNNKCRPCGDRDETINRNISECSKIEQREYKTRTRLAGKGDPLGIVQELIFDHTSKCYMQNPETHPRK